ncbi:SCP2 sterol-binding domain-containing protein [Nocardioides daeguensis]|uniref:SCP2 domain-containing protein n=1 Tax=Nocardioides daeguensis TaxID=908359 RepID=A0ABP6UT06_9ACTN|nr:SCP2 sterol-binding domain-containing protein [Nocardioides daeguensis]MBV6725572.1 SCP2 sterol-binding domain-containing protein [Nocardioides daeguensis]MCR1771432.1 SCP2 sterol-binding domain-containing protein [Nocardioides daeguensis]
MGFSDQAEVLDYLGGVFRLGLDDDELGPKLAAAALVLQFDYTEPDTTVTVNTATGEIVAGTIDGVEPDATMTMTAETANKFWQGKVNLAMAMARGLVKVNGNKTALLKLVPLSKKLYPMYADRLRADGRDDLVA